MLQELEEADNKLSVNVKRENPERDNDTVTSRSLRSHGRRTRLLPCKMGNKTGRLQCGLNILYRFKQEKNKVIPELWSLQCLCTQPVTSLSANISKDNSDLVTLQERLI